MDELELDPKYPHESIEAVFRRFQDAIHDIAHADPKIDDCGDMASFIMTAALRIATGTFNIVASNNDDDPHDLRDTFINSLKGLTFERLQ